MSLMTRYRAFYLRRGMTARKFLPSWNVYVKPSTIPKEAWLKVSINDMVIIGPITIETLGYLIKCGGYIDWWDILNAPRTGVKVMVKYIPIDGK